MNISLHVYVTYTIMLLYYISDLLQLAMESRDNRMKLKHLESLQEAADRSEEVNKWMSACASGYQHKLWLGKPLHSYMPQVVISGSVLHLVVNRSKTVWCDINRINFSDGKRICSAPTYNQQIQSKINGFFLFTPNVTCPSIYIFKHYFSKQLS